MKAVDLHLTRGGKVVLEGVDLDLRAGEVLCVLGPNGAGKSSLLSAMSGILSPSSGQVELDGKSLAHWHPLALAKRRAVLTQNAQMAFTFKALDVVLMGRYPHSQGHPSAQERRLARRALERVGAEELIHRPITALSGGEQQRIHLARALVQLWDRQGAWGENQFLLLDEPTSNLDPARAHQIFETVMALAAEGPSVMVVAHDLSLALRYCHRVLLLKGGRMQFLGSNQDLSLKNALENCFEIDLKAVKSDGFASPFYLTLGPKKIKDHRPQSMQEFHHARAH